LVLGQVVQQFTNEQLVVYARAQLATDIGRGVDDIVRTWI